MREFLARERRQFFKLLVNDTILFLTQRQNNIVYHYYVFTISLTLIFVIEL